MRSSYSALAIVLLAVAVLLIVVALVREGSNTWVALAGVACALAGAAVGSLGRRTVR
jgi:hypothetical protein